MKILHIINHMEMGGAQSLLVELAPVQKAMGHDVMVLELHQATDRTLVNKLLAKGIPVEAIHPKRSVRNPLNIYSIIRYLKRCDVAHVHLFPANYWTVIAKLLSLSRTPLVTTEHSTDNKRRKIKVFKYIDTFIYKRYSDVIACSDKAMETFNARYQSVRCISIPNGVDISKYAMAEPYLKSELLGVSEDTFVTSMVARFEYPKRQDTLVEAISMLPEKFHAVFVGGAPEDEGVRRIKNLASTLSVTDRVHFLYTRPDVPEILKTSDVIVMSSEYEGLSLSSIEGMACGRPFVASDVNGLREVVKDAGELFECGNANTLSGIILRLHSDREYYNSLVPRCLSRAAEYDIQYVAEKYQTVYEKCCGKYE